MGRGERDSSNHNNRRRALKRSIKSDDSDEDYLLEEDEADDHSDELESLCGDVSDEESLGNFVDEEENEIVRKTVRSNVQKRSKGRLKNGINPSSRKIKRTYDEEADDDDYHTEEEDEEYHIGEDDEDYHEEVDDEDYHEEEAGFGDERFRVPMSNRKKRSARKARKTAYDLHKNEEVYEEYGGIGGFDRSAGRKKIQANGFSKKRKRRASHDEDDEDYHGEEDDEDCREEEADEEDHQEKEDGDEGSIRKMESGINRSSGKNKRAARDEEGSDADYHYEEEEDSDGGERLTDHAKNGTMKSSKKRKRKSYDVEEDDEDYHEEENDDSGGGTGGSDDDDDDNDYNDDDDDDDDEFTPEELDFLEEEEDLPSSEERKRKDGWRSVKKKGSQTSGKRKTGGQHSKKRGKKKRIGNSRSSKSTSGRSGKSTTNAPSSRSKSRRMPGSRKKKAKPHSDSDFVSSESSDHDFTISEEEREQVREANELCMRLSTNLRSSEKDQENEAHNQLRNLPRRKGKEKVEETKGDVGKQVCGICLTEEGKATIRGTLDCCNHFFCFGCIIEWSKVESRCPLCKQRFLTISKPPRSATRIDVRDVVIHVPERDQVYQPSEEELRDYLDPYENVICSECHEGGDDALMLLCDLCDSPAHTYCVGLGQEVPEGNWYCEGCRPSALGLASAQTQLQHTPTQRTNNSASNEPPTFENMAEIDLNVSVPETPMTPATNFLVSPRQPSGAVPVTGVGVSTLSGRRTVQRFLHSNNRFNHMATRVDRNPASDRMTNFPSPWEDQAIQPPSIGTPAADIGTSYHAEYLGGLPGNYPSDPTQNGESFPGRLGLVRGEVLQVPSVADGSSYGCTQVGGVGGIDMGLNRVLGREYLQPCTSGFNMASGTSASLVYNNKDVDETAAKQHIKSLVKTHLRNLSRDMNLGQDLLNQIGWSSCHTISAVCGFDHSRPAVHQVQPPNCLHIPQVSLMRGCCQACFDSFVRDVLRMVMESRVPQHLGFRNY